MRASILRQARPCRVLSTSTSSLSAGLRPASQVFRQTCASSLKRPALSGRLLQCALRLYSTAAAEAQAPRDDTPSSPGGLVTRFTELPSVGVHQNLVRPITDDMGYDSMTDVQSMTINPGLAGKDM